MIELIIGFLLTILILAYYTLGRNLSRPTILFVSGFLICACVALCWKEDWGLQKMSPTTALVIIGGALIFYVIELLDYKIHAAKFREVNIINVVDNQKPLSNIKLILFFLFQVFAYMLLAKTKMEYAMTDVVSDALVAINNEQKFEHTMVKLPSYVVHIYFICKAAYPLWCILLPYYLFKSSKYNSQKFFLVLNFITAMVGTLLSGGRTDLLYGIMSFLVFYYINFQYKKGWRGGLFPTKIMIGIVAVSIAFIICFAEIGYAVGRKESETTQATSLLFAIYCGAEIKNLDDYVQHPFKQGNESGLFAQYTLCGMYDKIITKGKTDEGDIKRFAPDLRFNSYGQIPLGNVYTTYYNFILDFGYWGAVVWTGFMSLIASLFYRKTILSGFWKKGRLDFWILFYGSFMPAACFLSFFSDKFFESFSVSKTIKQLIVWWFLILFFQGRKTMKSINK